MMIEYNDVCVSQPVSFFSFMRLGNEKKNFILPANLRKKEREKPEPEQNKTKQNEKKSPMKMDDEIRFWK